MTTYVLHLHHKMLFETLTEPIENRINYIKEEKPKHEIETRLSAMRILTPAEVKTIPKGVMKKCEVYDKAWEAWEKTREARYKACEACDEAEEVYGKAREAWGKTEEVYGKAMEAYYKTEEAYVKAWKAWDKAEEAFVDACKSPAMIKWHKKVCRDECPWDGETLFP